MNRPLEIAFFGSRLLSDHGNGAATCYRGIARALAARGHRITFYEPDASERQQHRDMDDPSWARVVVYSADSEHALAAVERVRGADLVFKASGVGLFDELLESAVLELQGTGTWVAFWDVDAPATLDRINGKPDDPFRALIPRYDLILTYGGGTPVVDAYKRLGARKCVPIYNALDPNTHFPVASEPRFEGHLGFLGNRLPDREARVEEFFLHVAAALPDYDFVLGGSGWADKPMTANVRYVGHVTTRDHNAFNCSAGAVLNINRGSMAEYGLSPPTCIFEAAGAGVCLITDAWDGIDQFLEPNKEVLVAHGGTEVRELIAGLTPMKTEQIGEAALRRVLSEHTYAHRCAELEGVLEGCAGRRDASSTRTQSMKRRL